MNSAHGSLAQDLLPQLQAIAEGNGYRFVTRLELIVGSLHGVTAGDLKSQLMEIFENTVFEDVALDVTIVEPMQGVRAPGRDETVDANGWEVLIVRIEGAR